MIFFFWKIKTPVFQDKIVNLEDGLVIFTKNLSKNSAYFLLFIFLFSSII